MTQTKTAEKSLSFVHGEVLGNVDHQWREVAAIRGALRLTPEKVRGALHSLRVKGLVESRRHVRTCPTCGHAVERVEWRLVTTLGRGTPVLEEPATLPSGDERVASLT